MAGDQRQEIIKYFMFLIEVWGGAYTIQILLNILLTGFHKELVLAVQLESGIDLRFMLWQHMFLGLYWGGGRGVAEGVSIYYFFG